MSELKLLHWEREFRAAAKADDYSLFREHLRRLDLPDNPTPMMKGTILMVKACVAYARTDVQWLDKLLTMQNYNPAKSPDAQYMLTFDIFGEIYARLLDNFEMASIDLADLYGHPWMDCRLVGYKGLWVSHVDGTDLTKREMQFIEKQVTNDLYFDYEEDEIDIIFSEAPSSKYLFICVQDRGDPINV